MVVFTNPDIRNIFITGLRENVFNRLNVNDLARCSRVCRLFRSTIAKMPQMREMEKTLMRKYKTIFDAIPTLTETIPQILSLQILGSNFSLRNDIPFKVQNVPSGFKIYKTNSEGVEFLFYERKYHDYGGSLPNCKNIQWCFPLSPYLLMLIGDNLSYFFLNLESGKDSEYEHTLKNLLSERLDMGYIHARLELRYSQIFQANAFVLCRLWFVVMNDYPSCSRLSPVHGQGPLNLDEPQRHFIATMLFHDRILWPLANKMKPMFDKFPWVSALESQGDTLTVSLTNKVEVLRFTYKLF